MILAVTIVFVSVAPSSLLRPLPVGQGGLFRKSATLSFPLGPSPVRGWSRHAYFPRAARADVAEYFLLYPRFCALAETGSGAH